MLKVGTTFSGIGAPEQALKNLKIPHIVKWACDIDKHAKQTYLANHVCEKWYDDITKIDINNLEYVDLYVFGFPCQDISRIGLQDLGRGESILVDYSLSIIDKIHPKYILFENVKNINSKRYKDFKDNILNRLAENYNIQYTIYNSLYFGVPQNRERFFCLGIRKDLNMQPNLPIQSLTQQVKLYEVLDKNVDKSFYHIFPSMLRAVYESKRCPILDNNKFAYCLTTKQDRSPNSGLVNENGKLRFLTPNECRKLQGFPINWIMPKSKYVAYKQFGNTITINVLEKIFENLLQKDNES